MMFPTGNTLSPTTTQRMSDILLSTPPQSVSKTATASLFAEVQDLKRIAPAGTRYSLADNLYVAAWRSVLAGEDWTTIADRTCATAVLYVLFPGIDHRFFRAAKFSPSQIAEVCNQAFERTIKGRLDTETAERMRVALKDVINSFVRPTEVATETLPEVVELLRTQPRAGATHPEHPRLVLSPAESHADHCLMTAVYAGLCAAEYGADPGEAFVCGLAHHLHNAYLPDCGWAGELALEPYLTQVITECRATALTNLPEHLRPRIKHVLRHHESLATPEGFAISAGDTLDRVLDVKWRVKAAAVTDAKVLGDLDLVHPGPLKDFQTNLLNETNLWITS